MLIVCDNCHGEGLLRSHVTNQLDDCRICGGGGELQVCSAYSSIGNKSVFRNQRCNNCNVREETHRVLTTA